MGILKSLLRAVTWWDGSTIGTSIYTSRKGVKVGEDDQGNIYYTTRDGKRRWVMFNGEVEASRVSAEWHGWLHHTVKDAPTETPIAHKSWERPHQENMSGTPLAYAPSGSLRRDDPAPRQDYEAWSPE